MITVIPPGAEITLWGNVDARVQSVTLREGNVTYSVIYWDDGGQLATEDVEAFMVEPKSKTVVQVGFHANSH